MRAELALVGLTAIATACGPVKEASPNSGLAPYVAYKDGVERDLLPTLSPEERAAHAAVGCSLWVKTEEGSCSIVVFNGSPTVLTVGHVAATLAHYTDSDNKIFMHLPGQNESIALNSRLFTTFGIGQDPAVRYDTDKDVVVKNKLETLRQQGQVDPLNLISRNDLNQLPLQNGSFYTLESFTRKEQTFNFVGDNPSDNAGSIVLQTQDGELCNGDSGIAFYQRAKNGLRYVLGVLTDVGDAKDKIVNNIPFRCGQKVAINPPQLVNS